VYFLSNAPSPVPTLKGKILTVLKLMTIARRTELSKNSELAVEAPKVLECPRTIHVIVDLFRIF
jgi:hypothetical protein